MTDYYTSDHFKLLNKWKGQKRDDSNPEQNHAYAELKKAYEVTEAWADEVKTKLFPVGWVEIRKRPTNQANNFAGYNWAKIYPSSEAPKELAYTVGIDAEAGFIVKIDTVQADPILRAKYEEIRGEMDNQSPIVAVLPAGEGLTRSFAELVTWSETAIRAFRLRYDEVVARLGLEKTMSDEDLLKHFDEKPAFQTLRTSWSPKDKALFCRLARAVHSAGLDWWHVDIGPQVRFGRKEAGADRAGVVIGLVKGVRTRVVEWRQDIGESQSWVRGDLTDELVDQIEKHFETNRVGLNTWLATDMALPGLWPDQLRDDPKDLGVSINEEYGVSSNNVGAPLNRIYYGPPGTGKTYKVTQLLKREYEQSTASATKEAWTADFLAERIGKLRWWEGLVLALHDLGGAATVSGLLAHPFVKAISNAKGPTKHTRQTLWGTLQERAVLESTTVNTTRRFSPQVFDKSIDGVWHLAGDWQDSCGELVGLLDEYHAGGEASEILRRYSFVTFHQSYGYEEFVEGLRPVMSDDLESSEIKYEIRPGVFKELCRKARLLPQQRFAIVIDEINRGNISKIFGELITLIEADKREGMLNAIPVTLPYSGESFVVPSNVDILGTMNTADRSLALIDTALRRRFEFEPVMPDARDAEGAPLHSLRVRIGPEIIDIPRVLAAINERIETLYDRDHCIGHAYLTPLASVEDGDERFVALAQIFRNRIVPLLEEYFFEDWQRIRFVLADNQKPKGARFIVESLDHEDDLSRLFGDGHELDSYSTKRRFHVDEPAFSNPDSYIGIYRTLSA